MLPTADVLFIFSLLLPEYDNIGTKGAPSMVHVDLDAVATHPVILRGVHQ